MEVNSNDDALESSNDMGPEEIARIRQDTEIYSVIEAMQEKQDLVQIQLGEITGVLKHLMKTFNNLIGNQISLQRTVRKKLMNNKSLL